MHFPPIVSKMMCIFSEPPQYFSSFLLSHFSPCRAPSAQSDVQKADLAQTVLRSVCATTEENVTQRAASASVPKVSPAAGVCTRDRLARHSCRPTFPNREPVEHGGVVADPTNPAAADKNQLASEAASSCIFFNNRKKKKKLKKNSSLSSPNI